MVSQTCPTELRFWCTPNNQGLPGVKLNELADLLAPILTQEKTAFRTDKVAIAVVIPADDTIPQNTEGDEVLTVDITPQRADSLLIVEAQSWAAPNTNTVFTGAIFRDNAVGAIAAAGTSVQTSDTLESLAFKAFVTAGSTSPTTFKLRMGQAVAGTLAVNGAAAGRLYGGVGITSLTVKEILQGS